MTEFTNARSLSAYADAVGATVISGLEVRRRGVDDVVAEALAQATDNVDALYVSVDIDYIDQSQAPGTAAPNLFGLDAGDVQSALRRIGAHPLFVAADLVEISPPVDPRNITGGTGASLVLSTLWGLASACRRPRRVRRRKPSPARRSAMAASQRPLPYNDPDATSPELLEESLTVGSCEI